VITLTKSGIELLDECTKAVTAIADDTICLNEEDAANLNELLEKVRSTEE
jgi:hypothetical protein